MSRCHLAPRLAVLGLLTAAAGAALVWTGPVAALPAPGTLLVKPHAASPDAAVLDKKLLAAAKDGSELMKNLTYLSDEIGPRLTGSPALKHANDWTAEKMKSYGLTNVHLEAWTIPVGWE